jgi:membrane-bound lytic murein transglycosylase C
MRKVLIFFLVIFTWITFAYAQNENQEFQKFLKRRQQEFFAYKKKLEEEFKEYKKIYLEEFEKYKKQIMKVWGEAVVTDRKKWVEYSQDLKIRKMVDFSRGEIEISVIAKNRQKAKKEIEKALADLLTEDKATALKRDTLIKRVEERLKKTLKKVQTANVEKEKILTPIFFKKPPTKKEVKQKVQHLLKQARLKVKKTVSKKRHNHSKKYSRREQKVYTVRIKMPSKYLIVKARQYKPVVENWAEKRRLSPALIFAIIHTESHFNPLARSPIPAYGLMQIVPQTAGKDATKILYGTPKLLSPSFLYNGKNNIMIGSTYFYLLFHYYFKGIKNYRSRLYCCIAAYNTGVGNVAKALTGTYSLKRAIRVANNLTPEEVYRKLIKNVPQETKNYLRYVLTRMALYRNI